MSSQKESLLAKIGQHFQSKYNGRSGLSQVLEKELEEISKKATITKKDLNEIDFRLAQVLDANSIRLNTYVVNPTMRDKSPLAVQSTRNRPQWLPRVLPPGSEPINDARSQIRSGARNFRTPIQRRNQNNPGFTDNSMYYFSPMDLQVLKQNRVIDGNKTPLHRRSRSYFVTEESRTLSPTSQESNSFIREEDHSQATPKPLPRKTTEDKLPLNQKAIEREQKIKDDIWHKIEEKYVQKRDDLDQAKSAKRKELTMKWAQELKMQIEQSKTTEKQWKSREIKENSPFRQVPKQDKHPQQGSNMSLMKAMDAGSYNEAWRRKMRGELYKITELHTQHTPVGVARHSTLKSYYDEQQDLWREQEEQLELREKLTKEAQRLKKVAQRQALDEQIKQDKAIKHSKLSEGERRWNRAIIRDLNRETRHKSFQEA